MENSRLQDDLMMSMPEINLKVDKYEKDSFYSDVVKKNPQYPDNLDQYSRRSK
jgi:hypothetical protein